MLKIRDTYKGKRCLIIGGAPSVIDLELSSLSVDYTFMLNKAYLLEGRPLNAPEALVIANPSAFSEYGVDALKRDLDVAFLSSEIEINCEIHDDRICLFSQWESPRIGDGFFQPDLRKPLYHGTSVAFTAIQIAAWMGFDTLILAGVDLAFNADEPHFYASTQGEIQRSKEVSLSNSRYMIKSLKYCSEYLGSVKNVRLISLSPHRNFDFIEYGTVEQLSEI